MLLNKDRFQSFTPKNTEAPGALSVRYRNNVIELVMKAIVAGGKTFQTRFSGFGWSQNLKTILFYNEIKI